MSIIGYLDRNKSDNKVLKNIIKYGFARKIKDSEVAKELNQMGFRTNEKTNKMITGSDVCRYRIDCYGLRKNKEHKKPNYAHENQCVHNKLKRRGIQDIQLAAKYAVNGVKRIVIQQMNNALGRKDPTKSVILRKPTNV